MAATHHRAERAVHAGTDAVGVQSLVSDAGGASAATSLGGRGPPGRTLLRDGDRVAAADQQVPGVEHRPIHCRAALAPHRTRPWCRRGCRVASRPRWGGRDRSRCREGWPSPSSAPGNVVLPRNRSPPQHQRGGVRDETVRPGGPRGGSWSGSCNDQDNTAASPWLPSTALASGASGRKRTELGGAKHLPHLGQHGGGSYCQPGRHLAGPTRSGHRPRASAQGCGSFARGRHR
jgi:hypothetical protein